MLFIAAVFYTNTISAQTSSIDSLRILSENATGKMKVDALVEYSHNLTGIDYKKAKEASDQAFILAEKINYTRGKALSLISDGVNEFSVFNNPAARSLFRKSILISRENKYPDLEGYALTYLGMNLHNENRMDTAKLCYDKAYQLLKNGENPFFLSFLYLSLSDYYGLNAETAIQFNYLKKCWNIREKQKEKKRYLPYIGVRLASFCTQLGEYKNAHYYLNQSQKALGKDTIGTESIALIKQQMAVVYAKQGKTKAALKLSDQAKRFYHENSFPLELANLLLENTEVYEELGNYEASLKCGLEALSIAEKNKFGLEKTKALIRISWSYFDLKQLKFCEDFALKALNSANQNHFQVQQIITSNLMGMLLKQERKYNEAITYFNRALLQAKKINNKKGIAEAMHNLGEAYVVQAYLKKGLEFELQSLEMATSANDLLAIGRLHANIGEIYSQLRDFKKAEHYLERAEYYAKQINSGSVILSVNKAKRELYFSQNKIELALKYMHRYDSIKDSLFNTNVSGRISMLQNAYEWDQKNKELEIKDISLKSQQKQIEESNLRLLIITLFSFVLLSLMLLVYRRNLKIKQLNNQVLAQNKELFEAKEEISAQNEELLQSNEEVMSQRDQLAIQNNELDKSKVLIEKQNLEINNRNKKLRKKVKSRTKELVEYIQQLEQFTFISSHNLRAPVARILGLGNMLELNGLNGSDASIIHSGLITSAREIDRVVKDLNLILEIRRGHGQLLTNMDFHDVMESVKINIKNEIKNSDVLLIEDFTNAPTIKTFRPYLESILLNLITNAIKYRRTNVKATIQVKTEIKENRLCLSVVDNGLGIDLEQYGEKLFTLYKRFHFHVDGKGIGLYLVKTQILSLGGAIEVISKVNSGTTFYVYFKIYPE